MTTLKRSLNGVVAMSSNTVWANPDGATTFNVPDVPATDGLTWLIYTGVVRG